MKIAEHQASFEDIEKKIEIITQFMNDNKNEVGCYTGYYVDAYIIYYDDETMQWRSRHASEHFSWEAISDIDFNDSADWPHSITSILVSRGSSGVPEYEVVFCDGTCAIYKHKSERKDV